MKCLKIWLEEKFEEKGCEKCPYARYEQNYFAGDYDEWCGVENMSDMSFKWYCLLPKFLKKLIKKYYQHKEIKFTEKWANQYLKADKN